MSLAKTASTIAIIGVRVRPNDSHLWDSIRESPARIVFCAGSLAGHEFQEWAVTNRPKKESIVLSGYFADEFNKICEEVGLPCQ